MKFSDQAVLITGSSSGIGYEAAKLFIQHGARVAINGRSPAGVKAAEALGNRAIFLRGDVGNMEDCEQLVAETIRAFGRLDILVNNAGLVPVGVAAEIDEPAFDRAFAVNVKAAFFLSKLAIEHMKGHRGGAIVNTGSIAGLIGPKNRALYSATKGALISMTRAMAADHAGDNIRVNCVCPGMVWSDSLAQRIATTPDPASTEDGFRNAIPVGRIGNPSEAAFMILVAASNEAGFMTGSILTIDGGASL